MLSTVDILAPPGAYWDSLILPVLNPAPDAPLVVREVKGLEPGAADVNSRSFGKLDGEFVVGSSRLQKRNIVVTLGLNMRLGAKSVSAARDLIYAYFVPGGNIPVRFTFDDHIPVQIMTVIESVTGDRFTNDPTIDISFICPQPNFQASEPKVINGTSYSADPPEFEALYSGTRSGGFVFELHGVETGDYQADGYTGDVILETRIGSGEYKTMAFYGMFIPMGWIFHINTIPGQKRAQILPISGQGNPLWMLKEMMDKTYWMMLDPALNLIRVTTPGTDVALNWTLTYYEQFGGV